MRVCLIASLPAFPPKLFAALIYHLKVSHSLFSLAPPPASFWRLHMFPRSLSSIADSSRSSVAAAPRRSPLLLSGARSLLPSSSTSTGSCKGKNDLDSAMDSSAKSFNPNKHLKEEFVSNLTGSSMAEVFVLSAIFSMLILLRHTIGIYNKIDEETSSKKKTKTVGSWGAYIIRMIVDFLSIVLPITLVSTVLSEWNYIIGVVFVFVLVLFLYFAYKRDGCWYQEEGVHIHSLRECVSSYRVSLMLITCVCILAVDFNIFPRRYAKTETYGTSLMDVGVGAFVFANSLVSRQARGVSTMGLNLKSALSSTSPLLVLGFARLVFTSGVDYQVHVGEYGVHWNFFFTLAGVAVLTSLVNVSPNYCGLLGSLVLIGYQICLMTGLNVYLLSAERGTDIISQNKQGIYSIFGYWGLHLIGVWLGNNLLFGKNNDWARKRVWILFLFFWCLTLILDSYVERPSRRMCNLTYVTFVLATNLQTLGIIMLSGGKKVSLLEQAINRNLLAVFIVANLLTGLVNLSMNTLFVSPLTALFILVAYGFIICCVAGFADYNGKICRLEVVKDVHILDLSWTLPCLRKDYTKKEKDYLEHLVGHEGRGSLLFFLKAKGWATSIFAGVGDDGMHISSITYVFGMSIYLTDSGLEKCSQQWNMKIIIQWSKTQRCFNIWNQMSCFETTTPHRPLYM
ncbi:unnamed protein product [Lactuca virosa]|uniref:Uncharacterized protein n=1 Tax=Lactuca virosa TaxID=75947 RepID=A0AAU9M2G8_9ASTR|nr:unnamed protein product [Lactuca virosa]